MSVPQPLPRAFRRQLEAQDQAKLDRILRDVGDVEEPVSTAGATAPGDWRRLRGIPAVGRGCGGTMGGSDPLRALLAKESRRPS